MCLLWNQINKISISQSGYPSNIVTLSQVVVNGAHFLEYLHRLPVSRVRAISVDGGVEIMSISFQNPAVSINQTRT